MRNDTRLSRRLFLQRTALAGGGLLAGSMLPASQAFAQGKAPAIIKRNRPQLPYGVASGDIGAGRGIVWSRCDRPARMFVDYALRPDFKNARRITGPAALAESDYTARVDIGGLPAGETIYYRVSFQDLRDIKVFSEPEAGRFRAAPDGRRDIVFQWSGDTAGQGWGINEAWGGMRIYQTMRQSQPDFFIHCGDTIYADGPIEAEVQLDDGTVWTNIVTEAKSKVAETLDEYRGNFAYNLLDRNVRAMNAEVPMIAQWDDHETHNNWDPYERFVDDERYSVKSAALLSARARRAFFDYMPIRINPRDPERIYRSFGYGPALDVFAIDLRSYRGRNSVNQQTKQSEATDYFGDRQLNWLKRQLLASKATWKVISSDMPLGLMVRDGKLAENSSNGDGPPLGRELEVAELLRFIKHNRIRNVVWFTADVHYTAAHYYDPDKAQFQDFEPFWEFVSGPLNSGTFGPNGLDNTFGPQVRYAKAPPQGQANLPPSAGLQFFGETRIDAATEAMTVMLKDLSGTTLYSVDLEPAI